VPIVCLDARHAKAALRVQINKTGANDAYGLAQVVRTGWFREIAVKSLDAQSLRLLLVARAQLVSQRQAIANTLRGLLKAFGHVVTRAPAGCSPAVCERSAPATRPFAPSPNQCLLSGRACVSRSVSLMGSFSSAPNLILPHRG
jgi:hypothetical protein